MSEYINNVSRRKEILKNVLRQLHQGRSVDEVKAEFGALAREAGSAEIAEIEQMLMEEGVEAEEIQRLCDVHVAVFREGLDQQTSPDTVPGHPVFTFRSENQLAARYLNGLRESLEAYFAHPASASMNAAKERLSILKNFDRHYLRKENLLFPFLEKYGFQGPSKVMWGIHDEVRTQLKKLQGLLNADSPSVDEIQVVLAQLDTTMREMFYKEEKILFPAALERLTEADWASIRKQESELGYFVLTPASQWQPKAQVVVSMQTDTASPAQVVSGELPLDTGLLTLEQINMMLRNLPVDITFVDENDTVRYFSQSRERIFERQPAIIGRQVQNCHPPQSVSRVQKILDDFRTGKRNVAEFWIQMMGKFVHIRYFAMHDAQGNYRGTIEVTQDIAGIRALQGERRLLNDSD